MGCLMFTAPGEPPRKRRALNANAALIFTPDLVAALPSLPPPIRDAVEKLPEMKRVRAKPYISELRAIDPLTGKTKWAVPSLGWQDRGGVLATRSGLIFQGTAGGRFTRAEFRYRQAAEIHRHRHLDPRRADEL